MWIKKYYKGIKPGIICLFIFLSSLYGIVDGQIIVVNAAANQAVSAANIDSKTENAKLQSINEINRYLSGMNTEDINAVLKLIKVTELIKYNYVDDVESSKLITGAIKGTVNTLDDPYSVYMDEKMYKELMVETKGSFGGVGLILGVKDNVLTVVAPIEGTPGAEAGIVSGDQILKINGQDTKNLALDEAVGLIRGPEGSHVTLHVARDGQELGEYNLTRATIPLRTVAGKMLDGNIGYIRIVMFSEHTGDDFLKKLQELEGQGLKGIILDLRNNPGGLLEESIKVAGQLVPEGPIVSVAGRNGIRQTYFSHLSTIRYPLTVLVNGGSASASEILAGAIQDTGAGVLVGTKTFGKGLVQSVVPLADSTAVKLTVAQYFTPQGRYINKIGIEPDILVQLSEADNQDVQLNKAIEYLKGNFDSQQAE